MSVRLVWAILSTLVEEAALVAIALLGLPKLGIEINLPVIAGLIAVMVAWGAYAVISYRLGSQALSKKSMVGLPDMVGSKGKVVSPLAPEGLVRIRGELWVAKSASGEMRPGGEVIVVKQDGLKLVVRENSTTDDLGKTE